MCKNQYFTSFLKSNNAQQPAPPPKKYATFLPVNSDHICLLAWCETIERNQFVHSDI